MGGDSFVSSGYYSFHTITTFASLGMTSLNLALVRENFEKQTHSAFKSLLDQPDFADVTLVSEDEKQIEAHKVILGAGSAFFKRIFLWNSHPKPLMFLRVSQRHLQEVLNFLYLGECMVGQDELEQFLEVAEYLQISGLNADLKNQHVDKKESENGRSIRKTGRKIKLTENQIQRENGATFEKEMKAEPFCEDDKNLCSICSKTLSTKQSLRNHIRSVHRSAKKDDLHYPSDDEEEMLYFDEKSKEAGGLQEMRMYRGEQAYDKHNFAFRRIHARDKISRGNYYKCHSRTCPVRVLTREGKILYRRNRHNHSPMPDMIKVRRIEAEMMEEILKDPATAHIKVLVSSISARILTPEMALFTSSFGSLEKKLKRRLTKLKEFTYGN